MEKDLDIKLYNEYLDGEKGAFELLYNKYNNYGGSVKSEALIETLKSAISNKGREFIFNNDFIIYLKEENKQKPYFALKVDNNDILEKKEEKIN